MAWGQLAAARDHPKSCVGGMRTASTMFRPLTELIKALPIGNRAAHLNFLRTNNIFPPLCAGWLDHLDGDESRPHGCGQAFGAVRRSFVGQMSQDMISVNSCRPTRSIIAWIHRFTLWRTIILWSIDWSGDITGTNLFCLGFFWFCLSQRKRTREKIGEACSLMAIVCVWLLWVTSKACNVYGNDWKAIRIRRKGHRILTRVTYSKRYWPNVT